MAGSDDRAGEVPAQAGPLGLVDQPQLVEEAAGDREVDGVDRRGGDLDPDLAWARLDDGNIDDLDRVGSAWRADHGGAEGGRAHGWAPLLWCSLSLHHGGLLLSIGK